MYPVSSNFHTLSIQDAPTTRVRIYFIGDAVDCTDDNDVQTNGTLLKWAVGDTDSNRRIGQDGIKFTEYYNPEYNVTIGRAVSSQIEMTLINTDGALNNFAFGRCKVYLDVYDSVNSTWLACPMGVYIIELPTQRRSQLIHAFGYDQMQKLDVICDSWWNGLDFSGGLTMLQIVNSMASQVGVSVSTDTASAIINSTVTYTSAPLSCVEVTYRELLELIAEATGTVARFDRDGALDLKWFTTPLIDGHTVTVDTDTVGNQCLGIDIAEYYVKIIDQINIKIAEGDVGISVGSGTNQYTILNNLFLNGTSAEITTRATAIRNRLRGLNSYEPIQTKLIWDWSMEAGDTFRLKKNNAYKKAIIFQQTMTWRGGYVISEISSSGDPERPTVDETSRDYYRLDSEAKTITISADRINLLGYTTINNGFKVNLDGTFEATGATINGSLKTESGTKSVEMTSGMLQFVRSNKTLFSMDYDSGLDGIALNANTNNGVKQVSITGAGGPASGITMYDTDGTTIMAELTSSGGLQAGSTAGSQLLFNTVTGLQVGPSADIIGNLSASGTISATGDITSNGQSVVLKKWDETTGNNYTIGSSNYLELSYPTGLNGNKVVSISLLYFGTVSGPVTIVPYGSTQAVWYLLGASGTTMTNVRFRYWYI